MWDCSAQQRSWKGASIILDSAKRELRSCFLRSMSAVACTTSSEPSSFEGQYTSPSRSYVQEMIESLAARGTDAVILGCTELPLLLADEQSSSSPAGFYAPVGTAALQHCAPTVTSRSAWRKEFPRLMFLSHNKVILCT